MNPDLALHFSKVTESAALAAYKWLGMGDKNKADQAAVEAMRIVLNEANISGEIVIGEGEIDDAPMLYIGEKLGLGGENIDIAVDPVDGTRMTAMGQSGAVAVLAASDKGVMLKAPDMYMEKLAVGPSGKGVIDLSRSVEDNVRALAEAMNKPVNKIRMISLAKPRHDELFKRLRSMGVSVFAQPDGDVAASLLTCTQDSEIDLMYCMGGAPEGVISAAAMRALGGDMQARLVPRTEAKGDTEDNRMLAREEQRRCELMGVEIDTKLTLDQLVSSDDVVFSLTGITKGELVEGVCHYQDSHQTGNHNLGRAKTHSIVVSGAARLSRHIHSEYDLNHLPRSLQTLIV